MRSSERQFNALTPDQERHNDAPKTLEVVTQKEPIVESEVGISYLGVTLEKAESKDSQFVPKREQYADFINDNEVALPLQRDIAVAFLSGEPLLVDGGTSLGKTTTVKKMASELGWEVHYANLNGATDVEDLMGRYIPNPHKSKPEDPEYIFSDGKVTSGLRQEEGKVKVVILDEFNASAPNILIRLHEVLDALERNGEVVLSEDASEAVQVNKGKTKVIALMNPPGKGYFGREPLDPAQLRRWVYKKLPSELPEETFSYATDVLFGATPEAQNITPDLFLAAREQALAPGQLQEIPGIAEVLEKYKEFHKASKELLKNRKVAEDQPQPFTYDDRMEPRRVRDFILKFYNGDINETFQQALRYYYSNKLETDVDKKKFSELIRLVEYVPKAGVSKRKGLEREEKTGAAKAEEKKTPEYGSEFLEAFEKKSLAYIADLLAQGADKGLVAQGLAGLDSERAWSMREDLLEQGADEGWVAAGLAGLDSERAWSMREDLLAQGADEDEDLVAQSLAGVDSERAWSMREDLLAQGADKGWVAHSLAGLDSERAWNMREALLAQDANKGFVAAGLAGLDSERAWNMREALLEQGTDEGWVAAGLAGLDSERAWSMREDLLEQGADEGWVAAGLAGLDSERAWSMREELFAQGAVNDWVAAGLAGLDSERAWSMREALLEQGADKGWVAQGLAGDNLTFVWRLRGEKTGAAKTEEKKTLEYGREFLEAFEKKSLAYLKELLEQGTSKSWVAQSLAGLGSEEAWAMRKALLEQGTGIDSVVLGLAGLDSERAWNMREDLLAQGADKGFVAAGLAGLDSERAWSMRADLLELGADNGWVAAGLAGVDSERAWSMRADLLAQGTDKGRVAQGLAGLDSERAWSMRADLLAQGAGNGSVAQSLAGLGSEEAWSMREDLLAQGANKGFVAAGLAGLDSERAWSMRENLLAQGAHKGWVAAGLAGDQLTFVWRLRGKRRET